VSIVAAVGWLVSRAVSGGLQDEGEQAVFGVLVTGYQER
jgi:hypothetical protein